MKRLLVWGAAVIGVGGFLLVVVFLVVLLGLFDFFTGGKTLQPATAEPPFSSPPITQAISTQYLEDLQIAIQAGSIGASIVTGDLEASIVAVASGGRVFSQHYVCTNNQVQSERCSLVNAQDHTNREIAGLGQVDSGGNPPDHIPGWQDFGPQGIHIFNVALQTGWIDEQFTHDLFQTESLPHPPACHEPSGTFYVKPALEAYAQGIGNPTVAPSGFADQVKSMNQQYVGGPTLGAWADATWEPITQTHQLAPGRAGGLGITTTAPAHYVDSPSEGPLWIIIDAYGPVGQAADQWKPPTYVGGAHPHCTYYTIPITHMQPATKVWVQSGSGPSHIAQWTGLVSQTDVQVPLYPGSAAFVVKAPIHSDTQIFAQYANGVTASVPLVPSRSAFQPTDPNHPVSPHGPKPGNICQAVVQPWKSLIDQAAGTTGTPANLIAGDIYEESGGNPNAVSGTGAEGLMQLEPGTAASLGVTNPFNPQQNILGGATYLAQLHAKFGSWRIALAAYNEGPNASSFQTFFTGESWSQFAPHLPAGVQIYAATVYANSQEVGQSCPA